MISRSAVLISAMRILHAGEIHGLKPEDLATLPRRFVRAQCREAAKSARDTFYYALHSHGVKPKAYKMPLWVQHDIVDEMHARICGLDYWPPP